MLFLSTNFVNTFSRQFRPRTVKLMNLQISGQNHGLTPECRQALFLINLNEKKQRDQIYGLTPSENKKFSALKYQVF